MVACKQTKIIEFTQANPISGDEAERKPLERPTGFKAEPISANSDEAREGGNFDISTVCKANKPIISPRPNSESVTTPQAELSQISSNNSGSEGSKNGVKEKQRNYYTELKRRMNIRRAERLITKTEGYKLLSQNQKLKTRIMFYYSNGEMKCACCGESNIEFLSINHLDGNGKQHREKLKKAGNSFYRWLIQKHFPEGYNVLCFNCNHAQGHYEKCPHEGVKELTNEGVKEIGSITREGFEYIQNESKNPIQWHKSHRYLFVFDYSGPQPTRGSNSLAKVGRYKTIPQARFEYPEYKAIVFSLPHTLKIWIKHPKGIKTVEQTIEARSLARDIADSFTRKHGIGLLGEREARFSEHTIERKALDSLIRPVVLGQPELAMEKLGLSINKTSHKGKVHWEGTSAKVRVQELERWLDGGVQSEFSSIRESMLEMANGMKDLVSIIRGEQMKPPEDNSGNEFR